MNLRNDIIEIRKLFEQEDIFKAASPANIAKREEIRKEEAIKQHKAFADKVTNITNGLGFTITDTKQDDSGWRGDGIKIKAERGDFGLEFRHYTNNPGAMEVMGIGLGNSGFSGQVSASDQWWIKATNNKLVSRLEMGEDTWTENLNNNFIERAERLAQALGFEVTKVNTQKEGRRSLASVRAIKGDIELNFARTASNRMRVAGRDRVSSNQRDLDGGYFYGKYDVYGPTSASDAWWTKLINDNVIAKMAPGESGWTARHLTSVRYTRYCAVCGVRIPSNKKLFRLSNGQSVCLDCLKKAARLAPESVEYLVRNNLFEAWFV